MPSGIVGRVASRWLLKFGHGEVMMVYRPGRNPNKQMYF